MNAYISHFLSFLEAETADLLIEMARVGECNDYWYKREENYLQKNIQLNVVLFPKYDEV